MSVVQTIAIGVTTAVISTFIIEWIRESRKGGRQSLEKAVDFAIDVAKTVIEIIKDRL
jgi:hypothetical protein